MSAVIRYEHGYLTVNCAPCAFERLVASIPEATRHRDNHNNKHHPDKETT